MNMLVTERVIKATSGAPIQRHPVRIHLLALTEP
jgi:hypothetical protein